jgi:hypothetical protein
MTAVTELEVEFVETAQNKMSQILLSLSFVRATVVAA